MFGRSKEQSLSPQTQSRGKAIFLLVAIVFVLSACEMNQDEDKHKVDESVPVLDDEEGKGNLVLQVSKADEKAGITIETNNIYKELNKLVQENPKIGALNDFSLYIVDTIRDESNNARLLLLGINRLPVAIKNVSFEYTLGNQQGDYVWKDEPVVLSEEQTGILQVNSAIPIVLSLSEEQETILQTLNEDNQTVEIANFNYEKTSE